MKENRFDKHGIATELTTAVLLKPQTTGSFCAVVEVDTEAGLLAKIHERAQKWAGRGVVDPVYFSQDLEPMGPIPEGLDPSNLQQLDLGKLGNVDVCYQPPFPQA